MDPQSSQPTAEAGLCVQCAAFWGSPANNGLCSVCHKANQSSALASASNPHPTAVPEPAAAAASPKEATRPQPVSPEPAAVPAAEAVPEAPQPPAADAAAAAEPSEPADEKPKQENRGRCYSCRKKVGLLGFECRCGYVYCSGHRHAQDHACAFDYASFDKANLAKANTKVVAAKVDKL